MLIVFIFSSDVTWPHYDVIGHLSKILKFWNMAQNPKCDRPLERRSEIQENESSYDFLCQSAQELYIYIVIYFHNLLSYKR